MGPTHHGSITTKVAQGSSPGCMVLISDQLHWWVPQPMSTIYSVFNKFTPVTLKSIGHWVLLIHIPDVPPLHGCPGAPHLMIGFDFPSYGQIVLSRPWRHTFTYIVTDASHAPWWLDENPGGVHSPWVLHLKGCPWLLSWIPRLDPPSDGPWGPTALQCQNTTQRQSLFSTKFQTCYMNLQPLLFVSFL